MRPFGSPLQLEIRRRKAMKLLDAGLSLNEVARRNPPLRVRATASRRAYPSRADATGFGKPNV